MKSGEVRAIDAVRAYQWAALKRFDRADNVYQVIAINGSRICKIIAPEFNGTVKVSRSGILHLSYT